jgi:tRNA 2-selenouridine synthase
MPKTLAIEEFLRLSFPCNCIIDVRTPKEFEQGHIPGALNIPLFNNEERVIVGTIYKQQGKQPAILKGLEFTGPKMADIVAKAQVTAKNNCVFVHCWRGGMRSGSVAWLLELYGLNVSTLKGGYKSFRRFALTGFNTKYNLQILGGKTGSGKTEVLTKLTELGQQVIDLEKTAAHKGSAFGALGEKNQPSQEQFENELALLLNAVDAKKPIWLEDESRLIGNKVIPGKLWEQMRTAKTFCIELPLEDRVAYLTKEYGTFSIGQLKESITKITKRLGHLQAKNALNALDANDLKTACEICLSYYDKSYDFGIKQRTRSSVTHVAFDKLNVDLIAKELLKTTSK